MRLLDIVTPNPKEIAELHGVPLVQILDHLKEFPDYYDRLEKAER